MADEHREGWASRRPYLAFGLFWLIAYLVTWVSWARVAGSGASANSFTGLLGHPLRLLVKFGPALAGLILLLVGGPAVRGRFAAAARRVDATLLLLAVVVPGAITAGALALTASMRGLDARFVVTGFSLAGAAYWIALRSVLGGGLGEEPGLRGVALLLLLSRMGPRRASLVLGMCWGLWHLPVLWGHGPLTWIAQFAATLSLSIILTFVWARGRPTLGAAILFHGAFNGWSHYASAEWTPRLSALNDWQAIQLGAFVTIALLLLPLRWSPAQPSQELQHAAS